MILMSNNYIVLIPDVVTISYWLGSTTIAFIGLQITGYILLKKLSIEEEMKNNLSKRYSLIEDSAIVRMYSFIVIIYSIGSYTFFPIIQMARFHYLKMGIARMITNLLTNLLSTTVYSLMFLIKPSVRRKLYENFKYLKTKFSNKSSKVKKISHGQCEAEEYYRQFREMW
uniref:7TM_GPCR_Srx domain-containing protein n=1 Tax=Parastrongyloides trichosuri TaxID=131310 RepID=A0A0N4Z0G3_PARTI